jgi:hypothetical protein
MVHLKKMIRKEKGFGNPKKATNLLAAIGFSPSKEVAEQKEKR